MVQEIITNFTQLEVSGRCVVDMERRRDGRKKKKTRIQVDRLGESALVSVVMEGFPEEVVFKQRSE